MLPNDTKNPARNAMGRGLGALIPGKSAARATFFDCPIERVLAHAGQPRRVFVDEALEELAASIRANGVIQPLVVREEGTSYRLIAGERRLRAARLAGLSAVPVVIKDVSDEQAFELALIENIQREDLNPLEEAEAYQRLLDTRGYTQEELAQQLGRSRSAIANRLRLLKLDAPARELVEIGALTEGAARALLALPDPASQALVAHAAVEHALSVRALEAIARRVKDGLDASASLDAELAPPAARLAAAAPTSSIEVAPAPVQAPPTAPEPPAVEVAADDPVEAAPVPAEEAAPLEVPAVEAAPSEAPAAQGLVAPPAPDEGPPTLRAPDSASPVETTEIRRWSRELGERLGARVKVDVRGEKGAIRLLFNDRAELEALLRQLLDARRQS